MRLFVINCLKAVGAEEQNGSKVADLLIVADHRGHYRFKFIRVLFYFIRVQPWS